MEEKVNYKDERSVPEEEQTNDSRLILLPAIHRLKAELEAITHANQEKCAFMVLATEADPDDPDRGQNVTLVHGQSFMLLHLIDNLLDNEQMEALVEKVQNFKKLKRISSRLKTLMGAIEPDSDELEEDSENRLFPSL